MTILGSIATLLVGIVVGYWLNMRRDTAEAGREHTRWLRNERMAAYADLLTASSIQGTVGMQLTSREGSPRENAAILLEMVTPLVQALGRVNIVGPPAMRDVAAEVMRAANQCRTAYLQRGPAEQATANKAVNEAERQFVAAVGQVLGTASVGDPATRRWWRRTKHP